jgi:hypothetical protein
VYRVLLTVLTSLKPSGSREQWKKVVIAQRGLNVISSEYGRDIISEDIEVLHIIPSFPEFPRLCRKEFRRNPGTIVCRD